MAIHYYPFINKIINRLHLQDKVLRTLPDGVATSSFSTPFITVAREPGSGGAPIARAIAEKLDFVFVDEQIIEQIAKSTKKRKEIIKAIDEKDRTAIEDIVHAILNKEYINDIRYITELVKVILTYAHQGNCVILGRGGNFITPFAKGLHVLCTAPYKVRVQRAMDFEGHTEEKAKKVIAEVEKERNQFVKQYFKCDADKKNAYDLIINTSYFSVEQSRDVIIAAFYQKFPRAVRYTALFKH